MVAAAFASLNEVEQGSDEKTVIEQNSTNLKPSKASIAEKLKNATSVNELLATTENISISRQHALRV